MRFLTRIFVLALCLWLTACSAGKRINAEAVKERLQSEEIVESARWAKRDIFLIPASAKDRRVLLISFPDGASAFTKPSAYQLKPVKNPTSELTDDPEMNPYQIKTKENRLKSLLRGDLYIGSFKGRELTNLYRVDTTAVLDDFYTSGPDDADEYPAYGATVHKSKVSFALWAPTARMVRLKTYNDNFTPLEDLEMILNPNTGVWDLEKPRQSGLNYYRYKIELYHPKRKRVVTLEVTDPYSRGLSANGEYSLITDLNDPALKPANWHETPIISPGRPPVIYELEIGSSSYPALSSPDNDTFKHLSRLAKAGLTAVHLRPGFDTDSINEVLFEQVNLQSTVGAACDIISQAGFCAGADQSQTLEALLNSYDPASMQAFELTRAISKIDSFSEDARFLHAMVPDGAAASVPDGMARNFEFRSLIQSLHKLGLQVFIDAPYNSAAEEASLNEVVPNYYNTRETPVMEARYKQDALKVWTNEYKIDGFIERPSNSNLVLLSGKDNRQLIPPRPAGSLTLWDGLQTQNPDMAADTLMRLQVQALSNSLLSRNITYIKMGDDILRSRSFLPSGNIHGEWYNAVDFSLASNNSNKGAINETTGPGIASPSSELIQQSSDMVRSLMVMRSSSPLFALANPEEIQKRVRDIDPADGLSVRIIDDGRVDETLENLDPHVSEIIILRNTAARPQSFKVESAARLRLHPAQINGTDPLVLQSQIKRDSITIPAYTTAVFVRPE